MSTSETVCRIGQRFIRAPLSLPRGTACWAKVCQSRVLQRKSRPSLGAGSEQPQIYPEATQWDDLRAQPCAYPLARAYGPQICQARSAPASSGLGSTTRDGPRRRSPFGHWRARPCKGQAVMSDFGLIMSALPPKADIVGARTLRTQKADIRCLLNPRKQT